MCKKDKIAICGLMGLGILAGGLGTGKLIEFVRNENSRVDIVNCFVCPFVAVIVEISRGRPGRDLTKGGSELF
ncbi:hypothetical protein N7478_006723 [Penicillium angulare]|uniref:uncharacterized protein n=1 Tax=Penicillium angulare TaxID=116970 RepID=UPI0025413C47|nr:uncharacterized protein N7478_006723 [Penicillium angulare]KAJ5281351.1 hypothetical protein N7478_006723 [Penicillium angulare]